MNPTKPASITLAITGASGAMYGLRLLQVLLESDIKVNLLISNAARIVIATETEFKFPSSKSDLVVYLSDLYKTDKNLLNIYGKDQWMAPIASGSNCDDAMIVCPCSTGTLSAIAVGASRSLLERAADVILKEGRQLILVPRETPYSPLHLDNMSKLASMGVCILPASPGFYHKPTTVSELVDFIVARILDRISVSHTLVKRWGAGNDSS